MQVVLDRQGKVWFIDPTDSFTQITPDEIFAMLGILPAWLDRKDPRTALEQFKSKYAFGVQSIQGEYEIDQFGRFLYPESDPEYPLVVTSLHNDAVFFYLHAFVGIKPLTGKGETIVIRMD